jgi:hypothetical protein
LLCYPFDIDRFLLDFPSIKRTSTSRREVQGRKITLKEVNERDTVIIESTGDQLLSEQVIENIIESVGPHVFSYERHNGRTLLVEFVRADDLQRWMLNRDGIERQFHVKLKFQLTIRDYDPPASANSTAQQSTPKARTPHNTALRSKKLSPGWLVVIRHAKFGNEYHNYIRKCYSAVIIVDRSSCRARTW